MAISATCVFEVRTTGNDNNAGGFNLAGSSPGTDRSQQDAAQVFIDGVTITATVHTTTTQITIVGHTVSSADNRNMLRITGGTATAGLYEITAIDAVNNRWTLDRSAGSSTQTVVGRMGGALASPAVAAASCNGTGCDMWIKGGTYTISVNAFNGGAGSRPQVAGLSATNPCLITGYSTTRGDGGRPILQSSIAHNTAMFFSTGNTVVEHIEIDSNNQGSSANVGFSLSTTCRINNCIARNSPGSGFTFGTNDITATNCLAESCATGYTVNGFLFNCIAKSCTTRGFATNTFHTTFVNCIDRASAIGFEVATANVILTQCVAYGGSGSGFNINASNYATLINCIAYGRGGWGFTGSTNAEAQRVINCAAGNNTSGDQQTNTTTFPNTVIGFVTLSGDPFVDATNGDFNLITTGGGLQCRQTGYPAGAVGQLSSTTSFPDIGIAQEAATAATENDTIIPSMGIALHTG